MLDEKEIKERIKNIKINELPEFLTELMSSDIDYNTIVKAIGTGAVATAYAMNNCPNGGISGFQAGFVMWEFIKQWMYTNNKCGLRLVDYDNMLFPQYDYKFEKVISKETWELLQKEAKRRLEENEKQPFAHEKVVAHWKSIINGKIPFGYKISDEL